MLDMSEIIWKYVLDNSVRFGGKPNFKAIMASILGGVPSLRTNVRALTLEVNKVIRKVEGMSVDDQLLRLKEIGGGVVRKKKEVVKEVSLQGDVSNVVMRFAPFPSGPIP